MAEPGGAGFGLVWSDHYDDYPIDPANRSGWNSLADRSAGPDPNSRKSDLVSALDNDRCRRRSGATEFVTERLPERLENRTSALGITKCNPSTRRDLHTNQWASHPHRTALKYGLSELAEKPTAAVIQFW